MVYTYKMQISSGFSNVNLESLIYGESNERVHNYLQWQNVTFEVVSLSMSR